MGRRALRCASFPGRSGVSVDGRTPVVQEFLHERIIRTAIAMHANATYGDSRSPVYIQDRIVIQRGKVKVKAKGGGRISPEINFVGGATYRFAQT